MSHSILFMCAFLLILCTNPSFQIIKFRRVFFNTKYNENGFEICKNVKKNVEINDIKNQPIVGINLVNKKQHTCEDLARAFNLAQKLENEVKQEIEKKIYRTYLVKHIKSSILRDFITMRY